MNYNMSTLDYYYIDIGVNFAGSEYTDKNITDVLQDFYDNYGESVISISNSPKEIPINKRLSNLQLACKFYYTSGCHPHHAKENPNFSAIENALLTDSKCLCVGEIGLDFNRMFSPKDIQIEVFERQIQIAKRLGKSMYLHCRDAFSEFIECVDKYKYYNGVVHCFTGDKHEANEFVKRGFKLGITGWLLDKRRNVELIKAVESVPIESLMIETDAPFMALKKQKQSVPKNVLTISEEIARLKGIDNEACARIIYQTTKSFFSI